MTIGEQHALHFKQRSVGQVAFDLVCRPCAPGDGENLLALWLRSWQAAMPQIDFAARQDWFRTHLIDLEAAGFETIGAFDETGALLGFVTVNALTGALDQLAADPNAWGKGVASRLLAEARRLSPRGLVLDVNCDNPRAVRFYEREGFAREAEGINTRSGLKTWRMKWSPEG